MRHAVRAMHTEEFVRVYQAFNPVIAGKAIDAGRFVAPFKMDRMTWIKPSFNWMMYRSGYARKPQQEVVLALTTLISRPSLSQESDSRPPRGSVIASRTSKAPWL